ncbi:MAG: four helix bundle protein [Prevotella sp.]|nr:four helix bundle protein [Prevotella sp.]
MQNSIIGDKSMAFAIRIVKLYKYLTNEKNEYVLSKQLLRSGTSIGANTRESKNAQSKNDFLNKLNIALKEADESEYWLDLLYKTEFLNNNEYISLHNDLCEIIKILTTIIKTLKADVDKKLSTINCQLST